MFQTNSAYSNSPQFHNRYESLIGGHCLKQADLLLSEFPLIIGSESMTRVLEAFRKFKSRYQLLIYVIRYVESSKYISFR